MWVGGSMYQSRHEERRGTSTRRADSVLGLLILAAGITIITVTVLSTVILVFVAIIGWIIGGFGMGLARVLMLMLGQDSIREVTFLFRGPTRLAP